jgi:hypothetical protein
MKSRLFFHSGAPDNAIGPEATNILKMLNVKYLI